MNIITGMHRSGTSAVARLFYLYGANLGNEATFYPPDKWNTDGYFEQPDIHDVNMPLIHGPFGRLAYFCLPSENTVLARAAKMSTLIATTSRKYKDKIVKDTRFCLTLKAWRTHGNGINKVLVCLREPAESALSISKRNKIPVHFALKLWREHYSRLLRQIDGIPVWFIHYNELLDEHFFLNELEGAFQFMGLGLNETEAGILWRKSINLEMNHHKKLPSAYPREVEKLWRDLTGRHKMQRVKTADPIHGAVRP